MAPKILFVFTSNDKLHNSDAKTGWYLPEAAHPYYVLKDAGFELVAASEKGGVCFWRREKGGEGELFTLRIWH